MKQRIPEYTVGMGEAITDKGVLWPVVQHHGACGCGAHHLHRTVGYFCSKLDAEVYVSIVTRLERLAADKDGNRTV